MSENQYQSITVTGCDEMPVKLFDQNYLMTLLNNRDIQYSPLAGYPDYNITDRTVMIGSMSIDVFKEYGTNTGKYIIISTRARRSGDKYIVFDVYTDNGRKSRSLTLHRARLEAFKPRLEGDGEYVLHVDGNARNNNLVNLRWGTHRENMQDASKHGVHKGAKNAAAKINEYQALTLHILGRLGLINGPIRASLPISKGALHNVRTGTKWSHVLEDSRVRTWLNLAEAELQQQFETKKSELISQHKRQLEAEAAKIDRAWRSSLRKLIADGRDETDSPCVEEDVTG